MYGALPVGTEGITVSTLVAKVCNVQDLVNLFNLKYFIILNLNSAIVEDLSSLQNISDRVSLV